VSDGASSGSERMSAAPGIAAPSLAADHVALFEPDAEGA
jgi:hypothetical protein